jgi:hypothetical protein
MIMAPNRKFLWTKANPKMLWFLTIVCLKGYVRNKNICALFFLTDNSDSIYSAYPNRLHHSVMLRTRKCHENHEFDWWDWGLLVTRGSALAAELIDTVAPAVWPENTLAVSPALSVG